MAKKSEPKAKKDAVVTAAQDDSAVADKKKPASKASKASKAATVKESPKASKKAETKAPSPKSKQAEKSHAGEITLDSFGPVRKTFILENIRFIDYRDLAKLMGIKPDDLKQAVEDAGIRLPIERAARWSDIDVGTFHSLMDCARCQVQLNHSTFFVGLKNCRACLEKNIAQWVEKGVRIVLRF